MGDPLKESIEEMKVELNEKTTHTESSANTANQSNEEINIDDLLDCLTETYKEFYSENTANNPIQQQNFQAPPEYTNIISNESQYTEQTNIASQYTETTDAPVYTEMTNVQQQYLLPQIPSHWSTLYSLPNNAENADFVPPQIYKCSYCRKQCLSRAALTRHINNYHAKRHLRCWECGFFPISGEYLLRHDFYHHSHTRRYYYNVPTF